MGNVKNQRDSKWEAQLNDKKQIPKPKTYPETQIIHPEIDQETGWYEDPSNSNVLRWWDNDAKKFTKGKTKDGEAVDIAEMEVKEAEAAAQAKDEKEKAFSEMPVVENWKTSVPFSLLGLFCIGIPILIWVFIFLLMGYSTDEAPRLAGAVDGLIMQFAIIIYAMCFYKWCFVKHPRIKSNKAISFCNLFFGGVIFGCLWNRNLTRSHNEGEKLMGISYKVATIFAIIGICFSCFSLVGSCSSNNHQATNTKNQSQAKTTYKIDNEIFSMNSPAEPTHATGTTSGGSAYDKYIVDADDCYVVFYAYHSDPGVEGEDAYNYAVDYVNYIISKDETSSWLIDEGFSSGSEIEIQKRTFGGHPAGYVCLSNQEGYYLSYSVVASKNYVFQIYIYSSSQERIDEIMNSFQVK